MNKELKFDHFKNINELLQHIDIWYKEDDIDYTRWFHLEDLKKVKDYIINLQQENKQLKEEKPYLYTNTEWEDILEYQGKPYIELDKFKTIQQENKQLKEQLENDIDRYEDAISYQLGFDNAKAFYEKILTELEEYCKSWKENEKYCYLASNDKDKCRYDIWGEVLNKIQELKEKYK